jgi:hypothetical protein
MVTSYPYKRKEASHGRKRTHRFIVDTSRPFGDPAAVSDPARVTRPARVADPRRIADPEGITTNGDGPMMISSAVLDRGSTAARLPNGLPAELTKALVSLWTEYAGKSPTNARTEIRGNVVTCVLVDAVGDYNRSMTAPQTGDTVRGVGKLTPAAYKREAVAAVVRLTRQRVASFVSSHERDTDVATEVFTLEPSLNRGAPPHADGRVEEDFRLFPAGVV